MQSMADLYQFRLQAFSKCFKVFFPVATRVADSEGLILDLLVLHVTNCSNWIVVQGRCSLEMRAPAGKIVLKSNTSQILVCHSELENSPAPFSGLVTFVTMTQLCTPTPPTSGHLYS